MAPCSAAVALAAPHAAPRQCSRGPLEPCQVHGAIRCVLLGGQQQGPTRKGRQTRLARGRRRGTISKREKLLVTHQTQGGKKAYTNAGRRSPVADRPTRPTRDGPSCAGAPRQTPPRRRGAPGAQTRIAHGERRVTSDETTSLARPRAQTHAKGGASSGRACGTRA